jgi:integrase/recombinase XerD
MPSPEFYPASLYAASGSRKYLTAAERTAFIAVATVSACPMTRTFCLTLAYTGCRISEALALTWSRVSFDEKALVFRSLKKRSRIPIYRQVPVPEALLAEMKAAMHGGIQPASRVWPWCRSHGWHLVKLALAAARIMGGAHATPKGLRHGFGIHAVQSGVPLNLVQRWLGHARMETTAVYLQAIGPEERAIASRMW